MKYLLFFLVSISLLSCNQSRIENLEKELGIKSDSLRILNEQIKQITLEKSKINSYSNEEIIEIFKQDREFQTPKGERKNFQIRKMDENRYYVRYDYRHPDYYLYRDWSTSIFEIEFFPNDRYRLKFVKGNEHF